MKMQRIALAITVVNVIVLTILLTQMRQANAQLRQQNVAPVLRGRELQIVDSMGRVRASIMLQPPVEMNGKKYRENIILRLVDPNGKPMVKLGAAEDGAGLTLINQFDQGVIIHGQNDSSFIKITSKGKDRVY